jgi:hypothetical protein
MRFPPDVKPCELGHSQRVNDTVAPPCIVFALA